jgi:hypothetical protein
MKLPAHSLFPLAFSSLLAPVAMAVPIPSPVSLSAPADFRIVQGTSPAPLQFSANNSAVGTTTFDVSLTAGSTGSLVKMTQPDVVAPGGVRTDLAAGTPWSGASVLGGNAATIFAQPNLATAVAGDVVNFGISATNANWTSPVSASTAINVVQNRLLTGTVTIDAGRHMAGTQPIGNITLNGGALTGLQGTNITVNAGGVAQLANGLRLTSATGFTFNDAGQTHDLQISYNRPAGSYSISTTLPGAGASNYTDASGVKHQDFGGSWTSTAQYGNALGETAVLSAPNSTVWLKPGTSSDYIRTNDLASTPQPVFAETRFGTSPSGVTTPWELSRGSGPITNERVNPLISGEVIGGSSLDLSGISLNVSGTAVVNRTISGGTIDLGRRMVGAANESISRTDNVTLTTSGSDDTRTRLNLGAFSQSGGGVTADLGTAAAFTDSSHTAQVALTGNFSIDTSVQGRVSQTVNAGSFITGEGLAGETVQSNLSLGYTWNNVQNNKLVANDLLIIDYSDSSGSRSYSTYQSLQFATDTHTAIGTSNGIAYNYGPNNKGGYASIEVNGTIAPGLQNLGTTSITAIAEGLAGENTSAAGTSFNTKYASIARANVSVTHNGAVGGPLTDGNIITIADQGTGLYQAHSAIDSLVITGGQKLDYQVLFAGGSPEIQHGQSRTFTIDYTGNSSPVLAGGLSRVSRADLSIGLRDRIDYFGILDASGVSGSTDDRAGYSSLGTRDFALETRFDAPAASSGSATVQAGSNLGNDGLALENTEANTAGRFAVSSETEFLDSQTITTDTPVTVGFLSLDSAAPAVVAALENQSTNAASVAGIYGQTVTTEFASDIVNVTGLDGILHVLQVTYDDTNFDSEEGAQLLWQTTYNDGSGTQIAWINAVLGNSNITDLDLLAGTLTVGGSSSLIADYLESTRFEGSYDAYLVDGNLTDPMLGAWGFDEENNNVWAVIDHNSSFAAAIPEPGSITLFGFAMITGLFIRRRK